MKHKQLNIVQYFAKNILTVVGLVLLWRGIWYALDYIDLQIFAGHHIATALGGMALGLAILYLPDKDLKEIEKL